MNKTVILSGVIVCIVVLAFSAFTIQNEIISLQTQITSLQAQNNELENQNSELRSNITVLEDQIRDLQEPAYNFAVTAMSSSSWINPGGIWYTQYFNITIQNKGNHDVGGLTLTYTLTNNPENIPYDLNLIEPSQIGIIHAGETVSARLLLGASLANVSSLSRSNLMVNLMLDNLVLDKTQTSISASMSPLDNP